MASAWRTGMEGFFAAFPDAAYILDDIFSRMTEASGVAIGGRPSGANGKGPPHPAVT